MFGHSYDHKISEIRISEKIFNLSNQLFAKKLFTRKPQVSIEEILTHSSKYYSLTTPIIQKQDTCRLFDGFVGAVQVVGLRESQQDNYAISNNIMDIVTQLNGQDAVNYCLAEVNEDLQKNYFSEMKKSGATYVVAFYSTIKIDNKVYVRVITGHLGDSLAHICIVNKKRVVRFQQLTKPHNINNNKKNRLYLSSGASINLSRCLGEVDFENSGLTHDIETLEVPFYFHLADDENFFLILASDGIDNISHEKMQEIIFENQYVSTEIIAEKIVDAALVSGSKDNITVIVKSAKIFPALIESPILETKPEFSCASAMVLSDGNGKLGADVSETIVNLFFTLFHYRVQEFLTYSPAHQAIIIDRFKKNKLIKYKQLERDRTIENLLIRLNQDIQIKPYHLEWNRGSREFENHIVFSLALEEKKKDNLLTSIEELLGENELAHARYTDMSLKKQYLIIPLVAELKDLPPAFDIFLTDLTKCLVNFIAIDEEKDFNLKDLSSVDPIFIGQSVAPAIKEIKEKLNLKLTPGDKFINEYFPPLEIDLKDIQIMLIKKSFSSLKKVISYPSFQSAREEKKFNKTTLESSSITTSNISKTFMAHRFLDNRQKISSTLSHLTSSERTQNNIVLMNYLSKTPSPYFSSFEGFFHTGYFKQPLLLTNDRELGSLEDFLTVYHDEGNERLPNEYLLKMSYDIVEGLKELHKRGIWHGDFSTRNLCVTTNPFRIKIKDFSLSVPSYNYIKKDSEVTTHILTESTTGNFINQRSSIAAIGALSPEHLRHGGYASIGGDLFALGVVLWELFTPPPYKKVFQQLGSNPIEISIDAGKRAAVPACFKEIQQIIKGCWAHHPDDRPSLEHISKVINDLMIKHQVMEFFEHSSDFSITPPVIHKNRLCYERKEIVINNDLSARNKLFVFLAETFLASPQEHHFAYHTEDPERLLNEYKALIEFKLDTPIFLNIIKKNLQAFNNTPYLIANKISYLKTRDVTSVEDYQVLFSFPKETDVLFDCIAYLVSSSLCTQENLYLILENIKHLPKILPQLASTRTLNQSTFEKVIFAKGELDLEEKLTQTCFELYHLECELSENKKNLDSLQSCHLRMNLQLNAFDQRISQIDAQLASFKNTVSQTDKSIKLLHESLKKELLMFRIPADKRNVNPDSKEIQVLKPK